ncbi:AmmeMemoRadiSam system protein A [Rhodocyclus tenuis]|uniref:AMMECR1 domain-containing protein n=1 Tax=Rhodocyclus tenuis TaxID=1066 RepID=A0A840GAA0_RHOTE|nr:AmmeMemoRadiSam system protein A [Rhodocyclus tenuis]MBB4247830.1 hypothetical protein [Rhodocyclus tenuis]
MSADALGMALLCLARREMAAFFQGREDDACVPAGRAEADGARRLATEAAATPIDDALNARLRAPGATFVTITEYGRLRGCIGSLEAWRPLIDDVRANALAAAFRDSRFAPLTAAELAAIRVEVSLLGASTPLDFRNEAEALAQLRPGQDGVILSCDGRRATFLPQVWDELPDPPEFLAQLKRKAGLPAAYWNERIALSRYAVQKWQEA